MFSASTIKKWGGGSKEEAAIFLHGIEQDFGHKVQSIWEGNVLECAFAGDVNKLEIVKSCSKAAQTIIETYKDEKRNKRPFSVSSSQVNIFDVAKTVLQKKIRMIDNNMNDQDGLPLVVDKSGRARIDVTPRRQKVRRTVLTRNEKETIRRNLQKQLDEEEFTEEVLTEAKEFQKGLQEFNSEWREGETGTEAKRDLELLKCFRVCASRLITEAGTGRVPTDMADYKVHLTNLHSKTVTNSRGEAIDPMLVSVNQESAEVLEGTRRKMGASIVSESNAREVSALLGFVRGVKVRLQPFFWLCNLFKRKEEVLVIKVLEDVHASLAEVIERVYRQGGREATVEQANADGRVASGTATRYEVFEQGLEKNSRYLNEGVAEGKVFKGIHKVEGVGAGAPGEESAEPQGTLLALSLSKDPCAKAVLEKLTKLDARLTETFFQNSKEAEKAKSKAAEEEADKKKDEEEKKEKKKGKKRKAKEKEDSDSDESESGKRLVALLKENNKQILDVVSKEISKVAGGAVGPGAQDNQRCYNYERTGFCRFGDKCRFVSSHTGPGAQSGFASPARPQMGGNNYQNNRQSFSPQQQNQNQNFRNQNFQGGGNPQFQGAQFQGG